MPDNLALRQDAIRLVADSFVLLDSAGVALSLADQEVGRRSHVVEADEVELAMLFAVRDLQAVEAVIFANDS